MDPLSWPVVLFPLMWRWVLVGAPCFPSSCEVGCWLACPPFLGLEEVLFPFMWRWVLLGVSAVLGLEMVLSPVLWRYTFVL